MADLPRARRGGQRHVHRLLELAVASGLLDQDLCEPLGAELREAFHGELRSCCHFTLPVTSITLPCLRQVHGAPLAQRTFSTDGRPLSRRRDSGHCPPSDVATT